MMNKAILISIRPEWVAKILNGEKTIEVRKTAPKCDLPVDVYIYCTKSNKYLLDYEIEKDGGNFFVWDMKSHHYPFKGESDHYFNGKVVAKFTLREVENILPVDPFDCDRKIPSIDPVELEKLSCLKPTDIMSYLDFGKGYAWHISDLVIFDKPMELGDFKYEKKRQRLGPDYHWHVEKSGLVPVKRPPQSWQYVEVDASPADRGE